jgi:hypothetical protein
MAERFSTQALKQLGAKRLTINEDGRFSNTFQDGTGSESYFNAANIALQDKNLISGAINVEQYFVAKCFFERKGASSTAASTMALLVLDGARTMGISAMKALEMFEDDSSLKRYDIYAMTNVFRSESAQHTYMLEKTNKKSIRNRTILA